MSASELETLKVENHRLKKYEFFAWACPKCGNNNYDTFSTERYSALGKVFEYLCFVCKWRSGVCFEEIKLLEVLRLERKSAITNLIKELNHIKATHHGLWVTDLPRPECTSNGANNDDDVVVNCLSGTG